ncbi:penicillin-binding protein 2 [Actinocrinis sp.]|uniref:peptidoglycan D,D-transpeptidase FtsI family protein n=1 Tax=Actinocrinis sp. TaxID=1920516 RepID=UPI002D669C6A|nr:penicillin-binding protein 2 [Actinocrinis sp.]HZP50311.1 penicillin-binding protein 2 [Actinocrinis sp.]
MSPDRNGKRPNNGNPAGGRGVPPRRIPNQPAKPRPAARARTENRFTPAPSRPSNVPATAAKPLTLGDPRRRLRVGMITMAFILSLFGGRLFQLQAMDSAGYGASASAERTQDYVLTATRGSILDSAGQPLAESVDAVDITADPVQIRSLKQDPAVYASKLAALLGDPPGNVDVLALRTKLSNVTTRYVLLASQVTPQVWNQIKALGLSGVYGVPHAKTVYPSGPLASNVVGFLDGTGKGAAGLESAYNSTLAGKNGRISYQAADGTEIPTAGINEQAPVPGTSIETTIDSSIQWAAQQAIDAQVAKSKAESGTVVVMDPRTGAVLALATSPSYDPSNLAAANPADLGDRAVSEVYEPGSVAKVITMAAAIQQGVATPTTRVVVPGAILREGTVFHDDTSHGTEQLTLTGVLAESSNIGTIETSDRFGPNRDQILYRYLTQFGFGQPTGLHLPGESPGLLAPPSKWSGSQRYTIPFGQGLSVNAVQATSVFATIADAGVRVTPNLVKGYVDANGHFTAAPAAQRTQVVSASTAHQVEQMMESVVSEKGTAPAAKIAGYRVAGKTGTANRFDSRCNGYCGYTASFIGFAPADNPQLVVSVVIQNPTSGPYFGGSIAAPVFQKVMSFALQSKAIPPTGTKPPDLPVTW